MRRSDPEIDYLVGELMALKKKVNDLEHDISRQGGYLKKIASEVDEKDD